MARLQILELPTEHHGDDMVTPWLLVIDQADETTIGSLNQQAAIPGQPMAYHPVAEQVGARAILVFEETVDIPANGTTASFAGGETRNEVTVKLDDLDVRNAIAADAEKMRAAHEDGILNARRARLDAQEIADERTDIARDMDRLAKWKIQILDALGMNHSRDWDDIRNTAYGIRKQRDARGAAIERVRQLHFMRLQDDRHEDTGICAADADDWPCSTVRALDFIQADAQGSQTDA